MGMWFGIVFGILPPAILYIANFIRFGQKKRAWEKETGVHIQTNWRKHSRELWYSFYPYIILLHVAFLIGEHWLHPDFMIATVLLVVIQNLFLGMPYYGIKGLHGGFHLSEFLTPGQLTLWYEDKELRRGEFWYNEREHLLDSEIIHGDYIPLIQDAIPLIEDKRRYLSILDNLSRRPLSDYEVGVQAIVEERLKAIEDNLDIRWQDLLVAIGRAERPEVLDNHKTESVQVFEEMSKSGVVTETAKEQVDPALKELYALTKNEEAPEDIKELAKNAIRDIENKLEVEKRKEKEDAIRLSAQVVIQTSRQYHGLEA